MADARVSTQPVLATDSLSRVFGGLTAVRDVSIALHQGELHALIGPNGAGKSTLLNLLSGELSPTAGSIRLSGRDITGAPSWRMAHLGVGRSFQRTNIFLSLSVLENVRLGVQAIATAPRNLLRRATAERDLVAGAEVILDRVGLTDARHLPAATLAHGSQRQLEIGMALAGAPSVLLLDEPLAGMGAEETERMASLLADLARDHAVLLVEHDMDVVFAVADWMTVMAGGAVLAQGAPATVRADAEVQRAYLGAGA